MSTLRRLRPALLVALLVPAVSSLCCATDELSEWGIETRGDASMEETLVKARQWINKGNSVSLGGIARRVVLGGPAEPVTPPPAASTVTPDEPAKSALSGKNQSDTTLGYRVVLANGSVMTAEAVQDQDGGYWITATEGVEAYFTTAEVRSIEQIPSGN